MNLFKWFSNAGTAFKVIQTLDEMIKKFPSIERKKLDYLISKKESWINDSELIKKRIIEGYDKNITVENYKQLSSKYIEFYQEIFPNENYDDISQKEKNHELNAFVLSKINDDDALSEFEIVEIVEKSKQLNLSQYDSIEKIRNKFEYFVINGEIDKGIFPNLESDFIMQKSENCIYRQNYVHLLERKQVTTKINYSGPSVRLKIAKGLSYNIGSYNVSTQKELQDISKGTGIFNITTKRILFKSNEKNLSVLFSSIINIEPYSDAVIISKSSGNPLVFRTTDSIKLYQYLNGAIRNH